MMNTGRQPRSVDRREIAALVRKAWSNESIPGDLFELRDIDTDRILEIYEHRHFDEIDLDHPNISDRMPFIWFNDAARVYYLGTYLLYHLTTTGPFGGMQTIHLIGLLSDQEVMQRLLGIMSAGQIRSVAGFLDLLCEETDEFFSEDSLNSLRASRSLVSEAAGGH